METKIYIDHALDGLHYRDGVACIRDGLFEEPEGYEEWLEKEEIVVCNAAGVYRYPNGYMSEGSHLCLTRHGAEVLGIDYEEQGDD